MAPRVSVLMSVHNAERYVGAAIESILGQTFSSLELIIVDDACTDASAAICLDYANRDRRVKVLSNGTQLGLTRSLNTALASATGEYIARMDADDVSVPHRLTRQIGYLDERPDVGVISSFWGVIDEGGIVRVPQVSVASDPIIIRWRLAFGNPMAHASLVVRRSWMDAMRGYDERWRRSQDYDLVARLAAVTRVANIPEVLLLWRRHASNVSYAHGPDQRASAIQISREYVNGLLGCAPDLVDVLWQPPASASPLAVRQIVSLGVALYRRIAREDRWSPDERRQLRTYVGRRLLSDFAPQLRRTSCWCALLDILRINPSLLTEVATRRSRQFATGGRPAVAS